MNCSVSLIIVLFSSFYQKKYLSTLYYVKRTIYTIERFSNPIQIHEFIRTRGKMWIWLYWADLDWSYRTTSFCLPKTIWFSDSRHSKRMTHTLTWWWATFINVSINQSIFWNQNEELNNIWKLGGGGRTKTEKIRKVPNTNFNDITTEDRNRKNERKQRINILNF